MKPLKFHPGRTRRRVIISIICIALTLFLTHCNKRCEGFNYDIVQWLPYEESDRIPVSNSINLDTLTVVSREIIHTDSYPILSCCACQNSYTIELASTNLTIRAFYFDARTYMGSSMYINQEDLDFYAHYDTYEINGKAYSDVLEYVNYREDQSMYFSKIIVARAIGIVSIVGADGDWTASDLTAREIDPKKIPKTTDDC